MVEIVVLPDYLAERIDKRMAELVEQHPDVDQRWLKDMFLAQCLENNVRPEDISLQKKAGTNDD